MLNPKHTLALLVVLLLINSLAMPSAGARWLSDGPRGVLEAVTGKITAPMRSLYGKRRAPTGNDALPGDEVNRELERLRRLLRQHQQDLIDAHQTIEQLSGVRQQLELEETKLLPAVVTAGPFGSANPTITINKGGLDDVRAEQVVCIGGAADLVGRVLSVRTATATVELLTQPGLMVEVRISGRNIDNAPRPERLQLKYDADRRAFVTTASPNAADVGDHALLVDLRWQGNSFVVGVVTAIEKLPDHPLLQRRLIVKPRINPRRLSQVFVVIHKSDE